MLEAFVFDFDGTLIDTETCQFEAVRHVFRDHGVDLDVEWWAPAVGSVYEPDFIGELERRLERRVNAPAVAGKVRALSRELVARAPARPGAAALLDDAHAHGVRVAIASNAPRGWIESHLERVGLRSSVEAIVSVDDVRHGKPHPEPFAKAARAVGADPAACVAFEDSTLGVQSAVVAGLFTVAVPGALTGHLHPLDQAHLVLVSLEHASVVVARSWLA